MIHVKSTNAQSTALMVHVTEIQTIVYLAIYGRGDRQSAQLYSISNLEPRTLLILLFAGGP